MSTISLTSISLSILNINFLHLSSLLQFYSNLGIRHLHFDIIDTTFTNNISFGPTIVNQIMDEFKGRFTYELHFMIEINKVFKILPKFNLERVNYVSIDYFSSLRQYKINDDNNKLLLNRGDTLLYTNDTDKLLLNKDDTLLYKIGDDEDDKIKILLDRILEINDKCKFGLVINPDIHFADVKNILSSTNLFNHVLIMTVKPGEGGQKMIKDCAEKVDIFKNSFIENNLNIEIFVDGGITLENMGQVDKADRVIMGSYFTGKSNEELKNILKK